MDDLVKRAREALDGVTPGPWATYEHINGGYYISSQIDKYTDEDVGGNFTPADARLIAAARALVPAMADRIEALTADLAAAEAKLARAVKVKPLVWEETKTANYFVSHSAAGRYVITRGVDGWKSFHAGQSTVWTQGTFEAAKAAAQKDYESRILESLEWTPVEAKLAQAVEVLAFYAEEKNYVGEYLTDACGCCGTWYEPKIHADGEDSGNKARAFLATIQPEGETEAEPKREPVDIDNAIIKRLRQKQSFLVFWSKDWKTKNPWTYNNKRIPYVCIRRESKFPNIMDTLFIGPLAICFFRRNLMHFYKKM